MQIVIDIPDGCYEELNSGRFPLQDAYRLVAWIKNGTPLPKGHGRLIDADDANNHIIGFVNLNGCPTIIEAEGSDAE